VRVRRHGRSRCGGDTADFHPGAERACPGSAISGGGDSISTKVKETGDLVMSGEEALGLAGRFEPLHLPLPSSRRLVRVLGPVIETFVLAVFDTGHDIPLAAP
jgi:hypothetical protein